MTNILTITELKNSVLNANIDDEYIQPALSEAQDIYLREILGDNLLNAVINKINGNTLTGKYLILVNEYIKPYLTYMVQSLIVVPIQYKIRNAGVINQYDNGFSSSQMKDTQYLKDYYDGKAEFYGNRLTEYLKKNASDIVEYRLSASNITNPTTSQNVTNIFLGGTKRGKCGVIPTSGGSGTDTVDWDNITNRPNFATVATSGSYNDLSDTPDLSVYAETSDLASVATSGSYNDLSDTPELFSGDYNDLTNKPDLSVYAETNDLATVATSGSYNDLSNTPSLATVATSGSYNDLSNTPNLATVATSGSYNDLSDKPQIPTVNDSTINIYQGGTLKGSFNLNQANGENINLDAGGSGSIDWSDIQNKPNFATVATSGSYNDLSNKPDLSHCVQDSDLATVATTGDYSDLTNTPSLATVATSGSYNDLNNKPDLSDFVTQETVKTYNISTWDSSPTATMASLINEIKNDETATAGRSYIVRLEMPDIPAGLYEPLAKVDIEAVYVGGQNDEIVKDVLFTIVSEAYSGACLYGYHSIESQTGTWVNLSGGGSGGSTDWSDITNKPNFATVATSGDYDDLTNKPTIPTVPTNVSAFNNDAGYTTFDGDYNSLTNKPTIPAAQVQSDWNANSGMGEILNKPSLATVATTGNYSDLNGTPTIPAAPVQSDWNENDNTSLAYIQNKPTIPAAQVNSDWNANSGVAQILNKPTIPAAQVNSDWNAVSGVAQILNKPSLATVATSGDYDDLQNKPTIPVVPSYTTETWTFTLDDNSTVTKTVYLVPSV